MEIRLPQSSARRDHDRVAVGTRMSVLQRHEIIRSEHLDAVRHRFQIVQQRDVSRAEPRGDLLGGDVPDDVREARRASEHRARHTDGGRRHAERLVHVARERIEDRREAGEVVRRITVRHVHFGSRFRELEQSEQGLGAPDIAGQ
jgi:hypothetical protein